MGFVNVTLFGKSIFAEVIKLRISEMRSFRIIQVKHKSNNKYPYQRHTEEKHIERREGHVKMEVETGDKQLQAKECLDSTEARRGKRRFSLELLEIGVQPY